MVKHSVGHTVVHKPQKQHFAMSILNLAACKRTGDPSDAYLINSGDFMASISIQSTGQTFAHLSQTMQSSISQSN